MSRTHAFGIVGGYGATGAAVATSLVSSTTAPILLGGRDLTKVTALAAKLGHRVAAAQLDALEPRSLDAFCAQGSIIINCAGPVSKLQDCVAQAALRARSHYVDLAGLNFFKERRIQPLHRQVSDLGLSFVVSAGWMPGLSELLPAYTIAQARAKMETIESVSVYFTDSGEWSDNALRDAVYYVHHGGLPRPGFFRKGTWTGVKMSAASRKVDLGHPIGSGRFTLVDPPEFRELGLHLAECDLYVYSYLSGVRTALAATLIALLPLPDAIGVRLFRNIFRRNRLSVDGFVAAHVLGQTRGHKSRLTAHVVYRDRRDYWMNAVVASTVARLIAQGNSVLPGVRYPFQAVDPIAFMTELRQSGVDQVEDFQIGAA